MNLNNLNKLKKKIKTNEYFGLMFLGLIYLVSMSIDYLKDHEFHC